MQVSLHITRTCPSQRIGPVSCSLSIVFDSLLRTTYGSILSTDVSMPGTPQLRDCPRPESTGGGPGPPSWAAAGPSHCRAVAPRDNAPEDENTGGHQRVGQQCADGHHVHQGLQVEEKRHHSCGEAKGQ